MSKAVMTISTNQAQVIAKANGAKRPVKDNGWVKIGSATLRRLPLAFRKRKRHAHAYRLTASTREELYPYWDLVNQAGNSAVINIKG